MLGHLNRAVFFGCMACMLPVAAAAQDKLLQQCGTIPTDQTRRFCNLVVEAVEIAQPRVGLALTAGNPLPGAASTIGKRLRAVPRVSAGARVTGAYLKLPPVQRVGSTNDITTLAPSFDVDVAVGLLNGWSLLPTVGGFGSLDLVATLGVVSLSESKGFAGDHPVGWGFGARLGILRESFTAPGISITGMYRHASDFTYGDVTLASKDAYFTPDGLSVFSIRGVVGKRLLALGATAGIGWDRYSSDVAIGVRNSTLSGSAKFEFRENGLETSRKTIFGSLQFTMLVLSFVGEGGWQSGGSTFTAALPSGESSRVQKSSYFGTLAVRLAI